MNRSRKTSLKISLHIFVIEIPNIVTSSLEYSHDYFNHLWSFFFFNFIQKNNGS